jgi:hypothetical protein
MLTHIIDDIRGVIGRTVDFHTIVSVSGCSVCGLDPVTNTSADSFCVVCSGVYWIPTYSVVTRSGHVTWGKADMMNWYPGGQQFDGDCRVQIKLLNDTMSMLDDTEFVVVDEKVLEIDSIIIRGVPTPNRVLVDLIEKEK